MPYDGKGSAIAFQMVLEYDPKVLRFIEATSPMETWSEFENDDEVGRFGLGMYSTTAMETKTDFIHLKWEVLDLSKGTTLALGQMLVNRDLQTSVDFESYLPDLLPKEYLLYQNYPNPFKPERISETIFPRRPRSAS